LWVRGGGREGVTGPTSKNDGGEKNKNLTRGTKHGRVRQRASKERKLRGGEKVQPKSRSSASTHPNMNLRKNPMGEGIGQWGQALEGEKKMLEEEDNQSARYIG